MRRPGTPSKLVLAAAIAALPGGAPAEPAAPQSPSAARRTFAERVEVRVINLEAVVVDRQGNRVAGLGPGDFALEVDGRSVPIEYFSELVDGLAAEPQAGAEPLPPSAPGIAEFGGRVATSYLVFIDSYFTSRAARRNRILRQIEASLSRLGPEDRMAIVSFDGRKLEVLSSWSQSLEELSRALAEARTLPARGFLTGNVAAELDSSIATEEEIAAAIAEQEAALEEAAGELADTGAAIRSDGLPAEICWAIARLERRIGRAVNGVTASLRSFARPPGRKVMLVLAGGWPRSARGYLVGSRPFGAMDCPEEGPAIYRPIYETANRLGYTLYPIDVPPPAAGVVTAEDGSQQLFGAGGAASGPVGGDEQFTRTFEVHSTLYTLAKETGGLALVDGAAESAFDRVVEDTRTYYWLGFTPSWKGNDSSHKVRLRVLPPGLEVRSRSGYVDLSRSTEISYVTESALLFGELPGAQKLGLELGKMPRKGGGKLLLPLRLSIPMDAIAMVPVEQGFAAELELRVAVVDDGGNRNELPIIPVTLDGAAPPPPGAHAVYETSIRIRRRPHDIVVSLYDPLSDAILAASARIAPGP